MNGKFLHFFLSNNISGDARCWSRRRAGVLLTGGPPFHRQQLLRNGRFFIGIGRGSSRQIRWPVECRNTNHLIPFCPFSPGAGHVQQRRNRGSPSASKGDSRRRRLQWQPFLFLRSACVHFSLPFQDSVRICRRDNDMPCFLGVRNRLRIVFIVDCAQPGYETLVETHPAMYKYSDAIWMENWTKKSMMAVATRIVVK